MQKVEQTKGWIALEYMLKNNGECTNIAKVNSHCFVIAVGKSRSAIQDTADFHEYNINTDKWRQFPSHSFSTSLSPSIEYDSKNKQLIIIGEEDFELGGNELPEIPNMTRIGYAKYEINTITPNIYIGQRCSMMMLDGKLHVIGGSDNQHHLIWNEGTNKFDIIHTFDGLSKGIMSQGLVHLKSKNKLLMLGGYDYGDSKYFDQIHEYDVKNKLSLVQLNNWTPFACVLTGAVKLVNKVKMWLIWFKYGQCGLNVVKCGK